MNFSATTEKASVYTSEIVHLLDRLTATQSAFRAQECRAQVGNSRSLREPGRSTSAHKSETWFRPSTTNVLGK